MRPQYLLLVLSVLLLPLCTVAVDRRGLFVGGWTPIKDPNDPHVVDIALYAVTEYNKESNATLKFESVIKGETQVLDGINYRLDVTVIGGSETKDYEAVVYEKPSGLNLTSFKPLSILPGGWKPIENPKDPHVVEIAQFAVSEYDNESNATLKFERVIQGETQVVDGINYRLDVAVIDGSETEDYEAVVYEIPWEGYMNLTSFTPLY
ncbi:Cysteine proteinase inhibitor [Quillaja saponaria]|uniref:Cysteine proteinase inhibitor n=1 Tax=Quillaja saponaria TaxID=32244 RepID=A0AAD7KUS4_QUISA|nr:Cysteine proteinase inhibitor [Quillaja saponaria]